MSLDSYFRRSTKVIDDESTPECSPHRLESSGSTTVISATQATPLQKTQTQEQDKEDNSLLSQSRTLPLGLANAEEKEEKEAQEAKAPGAPKKPERSQETELTLLLTPTTLFRRSPQPDLLLMTMYLRTIRELRETKRKAAERKRRLWQLLLQRNGAPATPIVLVAAAPCCSRACAINTQRTFPRGQHCSSRSGYPEQPRRRRPVRSFERTIWLM